MNNFLGALATVALLLGEEEEVLGATLHTVHVVVHVEESDGERKGGDDHTVHLTGSPGIRRNDGDEDNLNDGQLGDLGHDETLLDSVNLLSGLGGGIHRTLAVDGHFYYLWRK